MSRFPLLFSLPALVLGFSACHRDSDSPASAAPPEARQPVRSNREMEAEAKQMLQANDFAGLEKLLKQRDSLYIRGILTSLADHLEASQAEPFYMAVTNILPPDQRQETLEHLFVNLGGHDLRTAVVLLRKIEPGDLRHGYLRSLAHAAAGGNLEDASRRAEELLTLFPEDRALLNEGFDEAMIRRKTSEIRSILSKEGSPLYEAAIHAGLMNITPTPEFSDAKLLQALVDAGQGDAIIRMAAANGKPAENLKLVADLHMQISDVNAAVLYAKWDLQDVEGAVASMEKMEEMDDRSQRNAAGALFTRLASLDMSEAAAELNRVPAGAIRDGGAMALIRELVKRKSFDEAATWADSISDPDLKARALEKIEKKKNAGLK